VLSEQEKKVLSYPRLADRLKENPVDKARAMKNLKDIAATYSKKTLDGFGRFLDPVIGHLYDGVNFSLPEGMDFKKLVKENHVILVPNHQSHADYLALNYIMHKKFNLPVFVAGGINLNIFPIGKLFRNSGCFFIRRSFANDILYKLTLEAYLYFLLSQGRLIEFFFEGGRSRTGKLLPPKYGLYHMLIEAHYFLPETEKKPLLFLPVSIIHEYVPEQKSLVREMGGAKKKTESTRELLKLYKVFSYQLGTIHLQISPPIESKIERLEDLKDTTQNLAFNCFRAVGRKMLVTPSSLLALVMLDEPEGALKWNEIRSKAEKIRDYCQKFSIPISTILEGETFEISMEKALERFISNKKIDVIGKSGQGHVFYSIKKDARQEILYFKNTILHHFIVPWIIGSTWIGLFNGRIKNVHDLGRHFLALRGQLKYEFYLPTVKEFFFLSLKVISTCVGKKVKDLEDCLTLSHKELYDLANELGIFSRSCSYFIEGYYIAALSVKALFMENKDGFKQEAFLKKCKDVFEVERGLARIIRYAECNSLPVLKNALKYLQNQKLIERKDGVFYVPEVEKLDNFIRQSEFELSEQIKFNMRV